jgi:hypothetical protein
MGWFSSPVGSDLVRDVIAESRFALHFPRVRWYELLSCLTIPNPNPLCVRKRDDMFSALDLTTSPSNHPHIITLPHYHCRPLIAQVVCVAHSDEHEQSDALLVWPCCCLLQSPLHD